MPSTGAEPPSPQQSQSPMHEEAPEKVESNPSIQPQSRQPAASVTPPQPQPEAEVGDYMHSARTKRHFVFLFQMFVLVLVFIFIRVYSGRDKDLSKVYGYMMQL